VLRHEYHGLYTSVNQNKNDFSICLKVPNVTAGSRSAASRAFQDAGPEVLKAHGPRVTVRVRGMSSWWSSDDRRRGRPWTVATRTQVVRCQTMKTFIRQQAQLVGDPLLKKCSHTLGCWRCGELRKILITSKLLGSPD